MRINEITVRASQANVNYWRNLWRFRELLYFLAWRDIVVRYKQTVLGIAWAILRPLATMIVLTVVFGKIAKLPSGGVPYPILVFAAMLPWQFFASGLVDCSNSMIMNTELVSKVFFPRLIIPASSLLVNLLDLLISATITVALMIWYQALPHWQILFLPVFLLNGLVVTLGAGLWFAALNVEYRDFRHVVPFIIQFGLYISPVGFMSEAVPEKWRLLYSLNPMVSVIDGFRWSILGEKFQFSLQAFALSFSVAILIFLSGLWIFRKKERQFADLI